MCQACLVTRAQLDKRPADVAAMFDRTAYRYDLVNDVLSLGQDRLWRRVVARTVGAVPGERVLDLAAGTGTSARAFAARGATCVACDFSLGMLSEGVRRQHVAAVAEGRLSFVAGDALALPLRDASLDAVTISFGLRNVADPAAALREMLRVTRPGGRLVVCEFSHVPSRAADLLYQRYLERVLPSVAGRVSSNPDAYAYLAESIKDWPGQAELARWLHTAGWSAVRWRNLSFGIVAVHSAVRHGTVRDRTVRHGAGRGPAENSACDSAQRAS
jgi:demethylmenaquinone methyltransferase/2-methoxy-6-polyprenyl-1,4-benzoquinol methylase